MYTKLRSERGKRAKKEWAKKHLVVARAVDRSELHEHASMLFLPTPGHYLVFF